MKKKQIRWEIKEMLKRGIKPPMWLPITPDEYKLIKQYEQNTN